MDETAKIEREKRLTELFLKSRKLPYDNLESCWPQDPPDIFVHRDGIAILAIEVTEYHPRAEHPTGRVGLEKRWYQDLGAIIDDQRRKCPTLESIGVMIVFSDRRYPKRTSPKASFGDDSVCRACRSNDYSKSQ